MPSTGLYNRHHRSDHHVRRYSNCNASSPAGIVRAVRFQRSLQRWVFDMFGDGSVSDPRGRACNVTMFFLIAKADRRIYAATNLKPL